MMGMWRDLLQAACQDLHKADLWARTALTNAVAFAQRVNRLSWHAKGPLMLFDAISPPTFAPRAGGLKAKAPHVAVLPAGGRIQRRTQSRMYLRSFKSQQAETEHIGLPREQKRWEAMRG